MLEHAKREAA